MGLPDSDEETKELEKSLARFCWDAPLPRPFAYWGAHGHSAFVRLIAMVEFWYMQDGNPRLKIWLDDAREILTKPFPPGGE